MSQPPDQDSEIPWDINCLTPKKTMFATEGNPHAVLVIRTGTNYRQEVFWFPHPITAFQWCLANDAGFVFAKRFEDVAAN